jgi:hypothetical protein
VNKTVKTAQKIVFIGDSHVRNCVAELQHRLGTNFTVTSFVKPGAGMSEISGTAAEEISKLKSEDVVVVWGGSNDISKNNSNMALRHLCKFVETRRKVNIVVMKAPYRYTYDLLAPSCVNNEVIKLCRVT